MNKYQFSFKPVGDDTEIVAAVTDDSKEFKGKKIFLNENIDDVDEKNNYKLDLFYDFSRHRQLKQLDYDILVDAVKSGEPPDDKRLRRIYNDFKENLKKTSEVYLKNSKLQVCPAIGHYDENRKSRECILVNGKNGSGKSFWCGEYLTKWQKIFPKSPIYLLSNKPLDDEPAFRHLKNIYEIPLTKETLDEICGTESKKLKKRDDVVDDRKPRDKKKPYQHFISKRTTESMVVFDDWEGGPLEKQVREIIDSVLMVGRSKRIYSLIITHELCTGKKGKIILSEINGLCLFSEGISPYNIKYCLKNYTKMNESQITKILDTPSRWVFIHMTPNYVVEENKLWLY